MDPPRSQTSNNRGTYVHFDPKKLAQINQFRPETFDSDSFNNMNDNFEPFNLFLPEPLGSSYF